MDYLRWVVKVIQSSCSETSPDFLLSKAVLFVGTFTRDSAEMMVKEAPLPCGSECKFWSWKVYLPPHFSSVLQSTEMKYLFSSLRLFCKTEGYQHVSYRAAVRMKGEGTCKDPKAGNGTSGRLDKQVLAFAIAISVLTKQAGGAAVLVAHPPQKLMLLRRSHLPCRILSLQSPWTEKPGLDSFLSS